MCYVINQVLCAPSASLSWVAGSNGEVPDDAVKGGEADDGEVVYIGRAIHEGTVTIGKVHPSHGCCYVAYGEKMEFYSICIDGIRWAEWVCAS